MKKIFSIISYTLFIFIYYFTFLTSASAQSSQPEVFVRDLVLSKKVYQAGETATGTFIFFNNKTQSVSDVYYEVALAGDYQKNTLANIFYDKKQAGPYMLQGKESKKIDFTYTLPEAVAGTNLGIQVGAILGDGSKLGWRDYMIKVEGKMGLLDIVESYISVGSDKYYLQMGPSVKEGDKVFLEITLKNPTSQTIEVNPKVKIYNQNTPNVIIKEYNTGMISVLSNKTSVIKSEITDLGNKPGLYFGQVEFVDTTGVKRAVEVSFRYLIPEVAVVKTVEIAPAPITTTTDEVAQTNNYYRVYGLILLMLGLVFVTIFLSLRFKKKKISFIILFLFSLSFSFCSAATYGNCVFGNIGIISKPITKSMTWTFDPRAGYFKGTLTLTNNQDQTISFKDPIWYEVTPNAYIWLHLTSATNTVTNQAYVSVTDGVLKNSVGSTYLQQLNATGNSDSMLDFGESITVTGVKLIGRRDPYTYLTGEAVWGTYCTLILPVVTFNGQGATVNANPTSKTVTYPSYMVGNLPVPPTRTGYTFGGWFPQGSSIEFTGSTVVNADMTVYAKWTINSNNITFDKNDSRATGIMTTQALAVNATANLNSNGFNNAGYTFDGWATSPGGAVVYANQASYTMGSTNVTLYAKWKLNIVTNKCVYQGIPIRTCQELQNMDKDLNATYFLDNDIDCNADTHVGGALWNGGSGFSPIGKSSSVGGFTGKLYGNGHLIKNLYINRSEARVGLFYHMSYDVNYKPAEIRNIGLQNVDINGDHPTGGRCYGLGGITGGSSVMVAPILDQVYVTGKINSGPIHDQEYVTGKITSQWLGGCEDIGGLVGLQGATINNSYSNVVINGGKFTNGGLSGQCLNVINNSYSAGTIISNGGNVGGMCGLLMLDNVTSPPFNVEKSFSTSLVSGNDYIHYKGNLFGANYNISKTVSNFFLNNGNCYYDYYNGLNSDVGCTKKTPVSYFYSKANAPMSSWDFVNVWQEQVNNYPKLRWEDNPCPPSDTTPKDVTAVITSCSNSKIKISWSPVVTATSYKVYKNASTTPIATTTATSTEISGVLESDLFYVSTMSGVTESPKSTAVKAPVGGVSVSTPTLANALNNITYKASANSPNIPNISFPNGFNSGLAATPGITYNFSSNSSATTSSVLYPDIHLDYYYSKNGTNWYSVDHFGPASISLMNQISSVSVMASTSKKIYYYAEAYPHCISDYKNFNSWRAGVYEYTLVEDGKCGSADKGTSDAFPAGTNACLLGNIGNTSGTGTTTDPWKWDCTSTNGGIPALGCTATKTAPQHDSKLDCSLGMNPDYDQVNIGANTTWIASTTPVCNDCIKEWRLIDSNNPNPGKVIPVKVPTSNRLDVPLGTTGLKTIGVKYTSANGLKFGNQCTATTSVSQTGGNIREI